MAPTSPSQPNPSGRFPLGLRAAPVFADREQTERARMFHRVAWATALLVTGVLVVVAMAQPSALGRAAWTVAAVNLVVAGTLALNRRGQTARASWLYLAALIALITFNATSAGGIRSPGIQSYFIFVILAGVLLGHRAGVIVAGVCVAIGLGLVVGEVSGSAVPGEFTYDPVVLWLLSCIYLGVALVTLRAATGRLQRALADAQAELAERKEAEGRLARALDAGRIGVFDHDLATGVFHGDIRALELTGLTPGPEGTISFDAWYSLVHPEDRALVMTDLARFNEGSPTGRTHYRLTRPDGVMRHMEAAAHLSLDAEGKPDSILGMIMDVTERKQAEEERERLVRDLGERVKELRLLHDAARLLQHSETMDQIVLADLVHRLPGAWLHARDAVARIRYRDIEVTSPGWRETPWRLHASFSSSEGAGVVEVAYRSEHPEMDEGPFLSEERALIDSIAELLRTHIEQHVAAEQRQGLEAQLRQAQKMDALGTLAGGIAHDFNNILTAIGGNADLALRHTGDARVAEHLQEIRTAHDRARDLIQRILLFSRGQASSPQVVALIPLVEEVLRLVQVTFPPTIILETEADPELPTVTADPTQLHQVLLNLATNAGHAMWENGGTLTVALATITIRDMARAPSADLEPGLHVRLTVQDTGVGMPREVLDRLFEPFFTTKGHKGTGLGLSVAHGIIRDHRGAITVSSTPGIGTRFDVYLPATHDPSPTALGKSGALVRGTGQQIFYIDDEPALALVMSRTIRHLGYRCVEFTDPQKALREFRAAPEAVAAVVTDLQMPEMSGFDLTRALRATRPDLPVAIASGFALDQRKDLEAPQVEWIQKPSTPLELSVTLRRMLTQRISPSP